MALTLEQLQSAFSSTETTSESRSRFYPFWRMEDDTSCTIRFLPDLNENNPMGFTLETATHKLTIDNETVDTQCLTNYGETCPICAVSSAYYKAGDEINGKKYWKKKTNLMQAIVIADPITPKQGEESHVGNVRIVSAGFQIFNIIKEAFASGELDTIPYAFEGGYDFIIKKTKQGQYPSYSVGTKFARKPTDLTPEQLAVVTENMVDLNTMVRANPGLEKTEELLNAALTGGSIATPALPTAAIPAAVAPAVAPVIPAAVAPAVAPTVPAPVAPAVAPAAPAAAAPAPAPAAQTDADSILAKIRARSSS